MRRLAAGLLLLSVLLGGCSDDDDNGTGNGEVNAGDDTSTSQPSPTTSTTVAGEEAVEVELKGGGLVVGDATFDFGTAADTVAAAITEALGDEPTESDPEECGGGADHSWQWTEISILAMDDEFVGWFVREGSPLQTTTGIGTSSTRVNLEAAFTDLRVFESSLGIEWVERDDDELSLVGTLTGPEPSAGVEDMWSGDACIAR